jgi:dual-specificity kinase
MPAGAGAEGQQPARKRRRSDKNGNPDWATFYKNGLPREIIIIDDTPEPEAAPSVKTPVSSQTLLNGNTNNVNGRSAGRPAAKKRKRDDDVTRYDPVHNIVNGNRTQASHSGSTISSDRTNSAIHTTAATSLGSLSSNGNYDVIEVQPGQKRKRTRQQVAVEAKKREVLTLGHLFSSYQPPPHPPKKANDVTVRVVADVSCPSTRSSPSVNLD